MSHLRNGLLLSTFLLLLVLALNKKFVGLSGLGDEVLILRKQELEIDSCLIKKHTGNGWGKFFTEGLHNWHIDIVSNKVISLITHEGIKLGNIDLRKLQGVLLGLLLLLWRLLYWVHFTHWLLLSRHHWWLSWSHLRLVHTLTHHSLGLLVLTVSLLLLWATSVILLVSTTVILSASSASSLESSVTTSAAASHVHLAVIHLTTLVLSIVWLLSTHLHATWSIRLTLFALRLDKIDELGDVISLFLVSCLLQIIFSLPEIDLKRLLVVTEAS